MSSDDPHKPNPPTPNSCSSQVTEGRGDLGEQPPAAAMITPLVDALCCGGASLALVGCLFGYAWLRGMAWTQNVSGAQVMLANLLINWPHFIASYRILYRSRQRVWRHRWVSLGLPCLFLAVMAYALATAQDNPPDRAGLANQMVVDVLFPAGVLLLAWHYTGQSWGMTATFLFLGGLRMERGDRRLIRSGYHALLVFHLLWATMNLGTLALIGYFSPGLAVLIVNLYDVWPLVIGITFLAGVWGFLRLARRTGQAIPLRAWLPWVTTFSWYALIYYHPGLFVVLQISHALQYIIFPLRVEINEFSAATERPSVAWHTGVYYLVLIGVGAVTFAGIQLATAEIDPLGLAALLFGVLINIHHYFIDGVIWKIRDPEVRQRLFGHL